MDWNLLRRFGRRSKDVLDKSSRVVRNATTMNHEEPPQKLEFSSSDKAIVKDYYNAHLKYIHNFPADTVVLKNSSGYAAMVGKDSKKVNSDVEGRVPFVPRRGLEALLDLGVLSVERFFERPFARDLSHGNDIIISPLTVRDLLPSGDDWKCEFEERGRYTYISGDPVATRSKSPARGTISEYPYVIFGFQQFHHHNPVEEIHINANGISIPPIMVKDEIERNPLNVCWISPFIVGQQSSLVSYVVSRKGKSDLRPIGVKAMLRSSSFLPIPPRAL